jgi:hypothetical protein
MTLRSSKPKKPLTRAEIQKAYRARATAQRREELRELVMLAYLLGRRQPTAPIISHSRLLTAVREIRKHQTAAKTSKRAERYLAALGAQALTVEEIRHTLTVNTPKNSDENKEAPQ